MNRLDANRLLMARWFRNATQKELSEKSRVSQSRVSKIENWLEEGTDEEALLIEEALDLVPGYLRSVGDNRRLPTHFYRKQSSMLKRDQRWIESVVFNAIHGVRALLASVEIESPYPAPTIEVAPSISARDIAQEVRQWLRLPRGPISDLFEVIESMGIVVVPVYGAPPKFDAMAVPSIGTSPDLIVYNGEHPADRLKFSVAHELGHMVMHRRELREHDRCEDEAHQFASEFITPAAAMKGVTRGLTLHKAAELKRVWGVSIAYIVYNAFHRWNTITQRKYKSLNVMISQRDWRKNEPVDLPAPVPKLFLDLVDTHKTIGYSVEEIGKLFSLSGDEFERLHIPPEGIRLVWTG